MPSRASDMAQQGFTVLSAKAANGEVVHINDHVYVSMPWSDRDGTPYIIARILEFVSAGQAHKKGTNSRHVAKNELHVRLSLYYRPSDISGRPVSDFRQLLGAIHTIVEPISVIRGKCYVRHKEKIEDLIKWKHQPDHFYFNKFFDPYIKREYEVLRTASVNNIPPAVKKVLLERYEYLLTEKEMVSDLLDDYHSCIMCDQWAASQDTVRCELCRNFYHMRCLTPPLLAKPAKGYSWACLACTIQRRKDVESEKYRFVTNGGSAPPRVKANKKERAAISDQPDVVFRGWPWRYFGLHTHAEDALNEEDLIFPRAVTRVGPKFTANVLTWEEQQAAEVKTQSELKLLGAAFQIPERGFDPHENAHATTLSVVSEPTEGLAEFMDQVARLNLPVPPYDINRLNKAVTAFNTMGHDAALAFMKTQKLEDFGMTLQWTAEEDEILERELGKYGGLEAHAISKVVNKRPAEVVRYTFKWRNKRLKSENDLHRQHMKVHAAHGRNKQTLGPPSMGKIRSRADSEVSEDEGSLYNAAFTSINRMQCAACGTRSSNVWWKCPRTVQGIAMCESCGSNYRKYGVISFVKSDDAKRVEKKDSARRRGKDTGSGASTPAPTGAPKLPPCSCCKRVEPKAQMARCKTCTFSAHAGCYGIPPTAMGPDWECELCSNAREEEFNLDPRCMLCPSDNSALLARIKKKPAGDFDLLAALKPTEGCRWAHILCTVYHPEVQFVNGSTMKMVEGISTIPDEKWLSTCTLCGQNDGAKVGCTDCGVLFHPSCAYTAGHKLGFEFTLAKPGRHQNVTIARFKDDAGLMTPGVWCRSHSLEGRSIYDLFEQDAEAGENALQAYIAAYKTISPDDSFALLRKAKRLDRFEATSEPVVVERRCGRCHIDVSPRWHFEGETLCHLCWCDRKRVKTERKPVVNGLVHAAA